MDLAISTPSLNGRDMKINPSKCFILDRLNEDCRNMIWDFVVKPVYPIRLGFYAAEVGGDRDEFTHPTLPAIMEV